MSTKPQDTGTELVFNYVRVKREEKTQVTKTLHAVIDTKANFSLDSTVEMGGLQVT